MSDFDASPYSPAGSVLANGTEVISALPLPECFLDQFGFVCCNRFLKEMIYKADDAMINANINKCNTEMFSEFLKVGKLVRSYTTSLFKLQNMLEKQFRSKFEVEF